jgi:hypothetical protein
LIALIDGDVIVYRTGWASEDETEAIACVRANKTIEDILGATGADSFQVWFSDHLENNFRFKFDPNYKISRQSQPKPRHYHALKLFLKYEWNAQVTEGQEADDELGIRQSVLLELPYNRGDYSSVICTNDKDLLQVPGLHYNFVTKKALEQDYVSGIRSFYSQFLIGDRTDDIEGVRGIGPKTTMKLLGHLETEQEMFEKVRYYYKDDERLLKNGRLLWVRREPNQIWNFPKNVDSVENEMILNTVVGNESIGIVSPTIGGNNEDFVQNEERLSSDSAVGHSVGEQATGGGVL